MGTMGVVVVDVVAKKPEGFNFPDSGSAAPVACALLYRTELHAVLAPVPPGSSFCARRETLLRGHRELVRKKWTYRSGHTRGERAPADRRSSPRSAPSSS